MGSAGSILFTDDGGLSWARQWSTVEYDLTDVLFLSNVTGWAVGLGASVIRTADGGVSWERMAGVPSGTSLSYQSVFFEASGTLRWSVDAQGDRVVVSVATEGWAPPPVNFKKSLLNVKDRIEIPFEF